MGRSLVTLALLALTLGCRTGSPSTDDADKPDPTPVVPEPSPETTPPVPTEPTPPGPTHLRYPDADGDGWGADGDPELVYPDTPGYSDSAGDCDDADPDAYPGAAVQEGLQCCADHDGDGYGDDTPVSGVDPGRDCDDDDPAIHPDAVEIWLDGIDQACAGFDAGLFDDFEGDPRPVFSSSGGVDTWEAYSGASSLWIEVGEATYGTTFDASACTALGWRMHVLRESAGIYDSAYLEVKSDTVDWTILDHSTACYQCDDQRFFWHTGTTAAQGLLGSGVEVRIRHLDYAVGYASTFRIDDLYVGCAGPDGDGDGIASGPDCDDADPLHYGDCGVCVDADGDGRGELCDLGPDCDDGDATVHEDMPDPPDAVDQDCDGHTWTLVADTFESGGLDPAVWQGTTGPAGVDALEALYVSWPYALDLWNQSSATLQPVDTSTCTSVGWSLQLARGFDPYDSGDFVVSYFDGAGWVEAERVATWGFEGVFFGVSGTIEDAAARHAAFALRLGVGDNRYLVDDLKVACD